MAYLSEYRFKHNAVNLELLVEELQAAGIAQPGVHVAPSGGIVHRVNQMPAPETVQNPAWPGWMPNPAWNEGVPAHVPKFIEDNYAIMQWRHWRDPATGEVHHPTRPVPAEPAYFYVEANPADYTEHEERADEGVTVTVSVEGAADGDMLARIKAVVDAHDPTKLTSREQAIQDKAQAKQAALSALANHSDPVLRQLAELLKD